MKCYRILIDDYSLILQSVACMYGQSVAGLVLSLSDNWTGTSLTLEQVTASKRHSDQHILLKDRWSRTGRAQHGAAGFLV